MWAGYSCETEVSRHSSCFSGRPFSSLLLTLWGYLCAVRGNPRCPPGSNNGVGNVELFLHTRVWLLVYSWVQFSPRFSPVSLAPMSTVSSQIYSLWSVLTLPTGRAVNPKHLTEDCSPQAFGATRPVSCFRRDLRASIMHAETVVTSKLYHQDSHLESERNFIEMVYKT